jgi:hypothetical protein
LERLLHGVENLGSRFRQIAREIAQERGLAQTPFVAVEDDPGGRVAPEMSWPRLCNPRPHSDARAAT